jgi:2-(1,2-epoxy-1,2-dihydrophenyl)acetyl-CoA isomerase
VSDLVTLTVDGAVAELRLNSPGTGNAMDMDLMRALRDRAKEVAGNDDVRAVLLSAEGRMFCAGGNLGWMAEQPDREHALRELASVLHEGLGALLHLDVPIVAAVHGPAAGAGVSLTLVAVVAYAARSA